MFKVQIIILLITLISCASSKKKESSTDKRARIFYSQGTQELQSKEYTKALSHLLKANKYKPNDSKILNNLGMAYYFKNATPQALSLIKKSIKVDPKNSDAKTNLGTIYLRANDFSRAESLYQEVAADLTYPKHYQTYYNLGTIALRTKKTSQAIKYFARSVKEQKGYCPSHHELGKIYFKKRMYNKALEKFKDASFGQCYNNPLPQYHQALTHIKLDQMKLAKQKLEDIIDRFSLTKFESMARNELRKMKVIQRREYLENQTRLFPNRKILSPDF